MFYPFFVDVEYESHDSEKWTPFTPVKSVTLAYEFALGEFNQTTFSIGEEYSNDNEMWSAIGEWIDCFCKNGAVVPVGFDLRNKVWPTLIANLVKHRRATPRLVLPLEKKWNNLDMVDLKTVIMQGGFTQSEFTLHDAYRFMIDQSLSDKDMENISNVKMIYELYSLYREAM